MSLDTSIALRAQMYNTKYLYFYFKFLQYNTSTVNYSAFFKKKQKLDIFYL